MDRKSAAELQDHMLGTYYTLRVGLAAIGIALPLLVLFAGGFLHRVWFEPSISQYYHTAARVPFFTTRDLLVGGLVAVAGCLYFYKGFSTRENVALNLGGVFALFVALLPAADTESGVGIVSRLHGTAAVLFFLCIAYVSLLRARDTLHLLPAPMRPKYRRAYFATGVAMVVSPLAAVVLTFTLAPTALVFWVESLGVWAFAAYWIVKTREMRATNAEARALNAELEREVVPATPPAAAAGAGGVAAGGASEGTAPTSKTEERIVPAHGPPVMGQFRVSRFS